MLPQQFLLQNQNRAGETREERGKASGEGRGTNEKGGREGAREESRSEITTYRCTFGIVASREGRMAMR